MFVPSIGMDMCDVMESGLITAIRWPIHPSIHSLPNVWCRPSLRRLPHPAFVRALSSCILLLMSVTFLPMSALLRVGAVDVFATSSTVCWVESASVSMSQRVAVLSHPSRRLERMDMDERLAHDHMGRHVRQGIE